MKTIVVDIDGKSATGLALQSGDIMWVHLDGQTFSQDVGNGKARRHSGGTRAANDKGEIAAPMPGKISKLNVAVGDRVQEQQVLVVMEAMKMEYTLKAPIAGQVKEVCCSAGEQVALGQTLIKLEIA